MEFNTINTIVAIFPGRFQPFSRHHAAAFKWLQSKFGDKNTYIATSNKVELPKSPLSFEEKKQIISKYGYGANLVMVKNPYKAEEITSKYDPKTTAVVFMVGEKDMKEDPRFSMKQKKDGTESYFKPYKGNENDLKGYVDHGYLVVAPNISLNVPGYGEMSGTSIRTALSSTKNPEKYEELFKGIFGWYDPKIAEMLKNKFTQKSLKEFLIFERIVKKLLTEGGAAGHINDKIECKICGTMVKSIAPLHLKFKHPNISLKEYKELYPYVQTISEQLKKSMSENNVFKRDDVKGKIKNKKLEKYGDENYNNSKGWSNHHLLKEICNRPENKKKLSEAIKRSYNNKPELKKLRSETIGIIGKNNFDKINQKKFETGEWISRFNKEDFFGYKERVRHITEENYKKYFYKIPEAKKRSRQWHLDHKYSILEGYKNDINEEVIGHWCNLEMLHHSINESKGYKSSISLNELFELIHSVETDSRILLLCGGAAGHMAHPFDIPSVKTGKDLISVFQRTANFLQNNKVPVKIDGVNASIRLADVDGKKQFVMDRGSNKPLDVKGITKSDLLGRFGEGHGMIKVGGKVLDIFNEALPQIKPELQKLGMLNDPNVMFNIEYVEGKSNVQEYESNFLAIHNLLKLERVSPTKRVSKETNYDKKALQDLIKKVDKVAKKYEFEVVGEIPATLDKKPNFASSLSKNYTVNYTKDKKETKSLKSWLDQANNTKGQTIKLKGGKKVDALSKQVFTWILNGKPVDELIEDEKDAKLAVDSFVIYNATMVLGDDVLSSMNSPLGSVKDQEGIVIRDKEVYDKPYKITGSFIIKGLESSFGK
jgi:hypothetical protein